MGVLEATQVAVNACGVLVILGSAPTNPRTSAVAVLNLAPPR